MFSHSLIISILPGMNLEPEIMVRLNEKQK